MDTEAKREYFQKKLAERYSNILSTKKHSDCSFLVGDADATDQQVFEAHKVILATASPVFGAMLFGDLSHAEKDMPIAITDVDPEAFSLLLNYIYTGRPNDFKDIRQAGNVCYAANKYLLVDLLEHNENLILGNLTASNACEAYQIGKLLGLTTLMEESWEIILYRTEQVLTAQSFENVDLPLLLAILDCKRFNYSTELSLFNAVHRWAIKECERKGLASDGTNLRSVVGPALEKIRFLNLTPQQFETGPAKTSLLTELEKAAIFVNIVNLPAPGQRRRKKPTVWGIPGSIRMPNQFSLVQKRRKNYELRTFALTRRHGKFTFLVHVEPEFRGNLSFSVDRDIRIHGLRLPEHYDMISEDDENLDDDALIVDFLDSDNRIVATIDRAQYDNRLNWVEMLFNNSVRIKSNKIYEMTIRQSGAAREAGTVCSYENEDASKYTQEGVSFQIFPTKRDFADSIYFSKVIKIDKP